MPAPLLLPLLGKGECRLWWRLPLSLLSFWFRYECWFGSNMEMHRVLCRMCDSRTQSTLRCNLEATLETQEGAS